MLLDVRHLIELLRSSFWACTTEACERLFLHLRLQEAAAFPGRRDFRVSTGLSCSLYTDAEGEPTKFEFPFPVPVTAGRDAGAVPQFVDLTAWPVRTVLGEPAFRGERAASGFPRNSTALFRMHWTIPMATIAIEARGGGSQAPETVALIIERPAP